MAGSLLTRRTALASGAALATALRARAQDDHRVITLGGNTFAIPKPFLFGEFALPGEDADGLPPRFSFAFLAPGGGAAGEGLEFPPVSHPYVVNRDNGQFLVMCYRVAASGPDALNKPPRDQLANHLVSTELFVYSKDDDALVIRASPSDVDETRYLALIDERNKSGIEALLEQVGNGQFFFGNAAFEKPGVTTVIYIPQERHTAFGSVLAQASDLLMQWKRG